MNKHTIKLGFRNLKKNKGTTFVNLFSLTLGLTILLLIAVFAHNEMSIDNFHSNASRIYKITYGNSSGTPGPLTWLLNENFSEIESATHIETKLFSAFSSVFNYRELSFEFENYYSADSSFFKVFDFQVKQGDIKKALCTPFSIVLTESEAERIFQDKNPIGKSLKLKTYDDFYFTVKAIIKDIPHNSSIQFNGLISESSILKMGRRYPEDWGMTIYESFILLKQNIAPDKLESKLRNYLIEYYNTNLSTTASHSDAQQTPLSIHLLRDVYFNQNLTNDTTNKGNLFLIKVLIAIGIIILALSIINYVNLATARASLRNKEIGVQKVFGSNKSSLIFQYLSETIIVCFIAAIISFVFAHILMPVFSDFMGFSSPLRMPRSFLFFAIPGTFLIGIIAGLYPAFILSSKKVTSLFKSNLGNQGTGIKLRYLLVVFQFFISISLVTATFMIYKQVNYVKNKEIGIEKERVIYAKLPFDILRGKKDVLRDRLLNLTGIENVAYSSTVPGKISGMSDQEINGKAYTFASLWVDPEFIELYNLQLISGRFFSKEHQSDINSTVLLNEAAVRNFDVDDPLKLVIRVPGGRANVIGVVKDFNFKSLHHVVEPMTIVYLPRQGSFLNIKLSGNNIPNALAEIKKVWDGISPEIPFSYHFLDETFDRLYRSDEKLGQAISLFSLIAILIAILGILSLSIFFCESKVKEIGIRKINGAKVKDIILLLNKGFVYNLLIAFLISCPVSFLILKRWLENFAYKTHISPWVFICSGLVVGLISFSIVSWQSWKFAIKNPADTLRYE